MFSVRFSFLERCWFGPFHWLVPVKQGRINGSMTGPNIAKEEHAGITLVVLCFYHICLFRVLHVRFESGEETLSPAVLHGECVPRLRILKLSVHYKFIVQQTHHHAAYILAHCF